MHWNSLFRGSKWIGTEQNSAKKCFFKSQPSVFPCPRTLRNKFPEWFGTSLKKKKIFFRLRNSVCFSLLLNGLDRNFEHFYLPRKGSERNYEVPNVYPLLRNGSSIFIFRGIVQNEIRKVRVFFSSKKLFGMEFQTFFIFCGMAQIGIPSVSVPRNRRNSD